MGGSMFLAMFSVSTSLSPYQTMPNFYYTDENGQRGLINEQQLKALAVQGVITPDTLLETDNGHKGKAGQIKGLFAAAPPPVTQTKQIKPPTTNTFCTYCGNSISEQATACKICGAKPTEHRKYCRHCGIDLNSQQVICVKCGASLPGTPPRAKNSSPSVVDTAKTIKTLNTYFRKCWAYPVLAFFLVIIGVSLFNSNDLIAMPLIFSAYIAFFAGWIAMLLLLYQLWKVIPADIARTTPWFAVGGLFIPFFNIYWIFVAYWGLGIDMNATLEKYGKQHNVKESLGLTASILLLVPFLGIFGLIVLIFFLKSVKNGAIALLEQEGT
jgi:hypothetical protein